MTDLRELYQKSKLPGDNKVIKSMKEGCSQFLRCRSTIRRMGGVGGQKRKEPLGFYKKRRGGKGNKSSLHSLCTKDTEGVPGGFHPMDHAFVRSVLCRISIANFFSQVLSPRSLRRKLTALFTSERKLGRKQRVERLLVKSSLKRQRNGITARGL